MLSGYHQSHKILADFRPDAVLGVGGYASLPLLLAARRMGIPSFIHEQNAVPGMTNKLLAKVVDRVFITVEESVNFFPRHKTLLTGNPLRRQILELLESRIKEQGARAKENPDLAGSCSPDAVPRFHLLVFGGSQGAHAINMAMMAALPHLKQSSIGLDITHQTGEKDCSEVAAAYEAAGIQAQVLPFINDMASEYAWADLIVCRAGATTIAEVTATGKACLFIPFPYAVDDHQRKNAEALFNKSACFMLLEQDLTGERLAEMVTRLAGDRDLVRRIGGLASSMARLDAAAIIVDEIMKISN